MEGRFDKYVTDKQVQGGDYGKPNYKSQEIERPEEFEKEDTLDENPDNLFSVGQRLLILFLIHSYTNSSSHFLRVIIY